MGSTSENRLAVLAVLAVLLLVVSSVSSSTAQSTPYSLTLTDRNTNDFTLRCRNGVGETVTDAVFLRNGALYSEDSRCLQSIASSPNEGLMNVSLTAECEGYYQCGVEQREGSRRRYVLSGSLAVNAFPVLTASSSDTTVEVIEGDTATLNCPVEISAFDNFRVTWRRIESGVETQLPYPINKDYSISLPNVTFSDSRGVYLCTVRSTPFATMSSGSILGPRNTLTVIRRHVPPFFSTNLDISLNTDGHYVVRIKSRGTYPLTFKWLVNSEPLDSEEVEVEPINSEWVIEELSQISFEKSDFQGEKKRNLTVVVQNADPNQNQVLSISHTSFLFFAQRSTTTPNRTTIPNPSSTTSTTDGSLFEKNGHFIIAAAVVFIIVIFVLVVVLAGFVCHYKGQRYQKHDLKTDGHSPDIPCQAIVPSPSVFPKLNGHPLSNGLLARPRIETAINGCITPCQIPQDPDEWPNPVSAILYRVARMYWHAKPSNLTLMRSLQQVLVDVLNDEEAASDYEAMMYIQKLRDEVIGFGDNIRECMYKRQFSRQSVSCKSRGSIASSGHLETVENGPFITEVETQLHDYDEPDGVEDEKQAIDDLSNIANMLNELIDKVKKKGHHKADPKVYVQEPDDTT